MSSVFGQSSESKSLTTNTGASDNAILLQNGSFIFNPGRSSPNPTLAAGPASTQPNWNVIVAIGAGALILFGAFNALSKH